MAIVWILLTIIFLILCFLIVEYFREKSLIEKYIACHEIGHTIIYYYSFGPETIRAVTIIPSLTYSGALKSDLSHNQLTEEDLISRMMMDRYGKGLIEGDLRTRMMMYFYGKELTDSYLRSQMMMYFYGKEFTEGKLRSQMAIYLCGKELIERELRSWMVMYLGGKAACLLKFKRASEYGDEEDLKLARNAARKIIHKDDIDAFRAFYENRPLIPVGTGKVKMTKKDEKEKVNELVAWAENEAMKILKKHEALLDYLTKELLKNKSLLGEEINALINKYNTASA